MMQCAMCGKPIATTAKPLIVEQVDGLEYAFDSSDCALIFKKFRSLYGDGFFGKV
jgi:hypothetical protein